MPEGTENIDVHGSSAQQPERSPEELAAAMDAEQARADGAAALGAQPETLDPDSEALAFLVEHDFFGVDPRNDEAMVSILHQMSAEYTVNVCDEAALATMGMTPEMIGPDFASRCENLEEEGGQVEADERAAEVREQEEAVRANEETVRAEEEKDLNASAEVIDEMGDQLTLPEIQNILGNHREYLSQPDPRHEGILASFEAISSQLSSVSAITTPENPEEAAALQQIVQTAPVNWRASAPSERYSAIFTALDAGQLSDDTRRRAYEALGVTLSTPERPETASELQATLRDGRGTEQITEIQRVEEPPGSGIYVEQEVVIGEEPIPFTQRDPLVLSDAPSVVIFPQTDAEGSTSYTVQAAVEGSDPVNLSINIPLKGDFPTEAINNGVNAHLINAVMRNRGMGGAMEALYGRGDSTFGLAGVTDLDSIGENDMTQALVTMFTGESSTLGGRFLSADEINTIGDDSRWLAAGGDFGFANQVDPQVANNMMMAMFGNNQAEAIGNMARANQYINTGGAEAPSYEGLYAQMYPEDAAAGYPRLRSLLGEDGIARLNLEGGTMDNAA